MIIRLLATALVLATVRPVAAAAPSNPFADGQSPAHWVLLGPIPGQGLDHDFLPSLDGEANARFEDGDEVGVALPDGTATTLVARAFTMDNPQAGFAFDRLFPGPMDNRVVYAFTVVQCERDLDAAAEFGSDDQAVVWVNGGQVHRYDGPGRATALGDDLFALPLRRGANTMMVKVQNGAGPYGVALRWMGPEAYREAMAQKARAARIGRAQDAQIVLNPPYRFITSGAFPEITWDRGEALEALYGALETTVRWFDRDLNEVTAPDASGRYGAYVEARTASGMVLRRALTVFHAREAKDVWGAVLPVQWSGLPTLDVAPSTWAGHQEAINRWASDALASQLMNEEQGPMLLAALWERDRQLAADPSSTAPAWWRPDAVNMEYQLALRAKVLGTRPGQGPAEPRWIEDPAPVLLDGTEALAGFKPGAVEAIEAVGRAWAEETGVPFNLCVVRHGVVLLNRGFGQTGGVPTAPDSRFGIASLSKFQTGILLTQFLEQGLLDLNDPIGHYLPDLPTEGDKVMTLRMCMSHTAGTQGHGNWNGFANPWFDNAVAMGLEAYRPGTRYEYNGLSLNLAGRVMEVVSGRSFVRLMDEQLYGPLGCGEVEVFDTSFGTRIAAQDLARVGQMLLNGGAYGHRRFFEPDSLEHLMPVRLGDEIPTLSSGADTEYGLGCTLDYFPFREDVPPDAPPAERSLLGPMLNHGSATGSTMFTGLENKLVIAMARQSTGPDYEEHRDELLRTVAEYLAR